VMKVSDIDLLCCALCPFRGWCALLYAPVKDLNWTE
jgi:hypothetical protein